MRPPPLGGALDTPLGMLHQRVLYIYRYTLGITPLPKGSLGLASAPKFRPMPPSTVVETSTDGSQKQWPVRDPPASCQLPRPPRPVSRAHTTSA